MHKNGYTAFGSKSAHIWPSQKETSTLTAKGQIKICKTKAKHAEKIIFLNATIFNKIKDWHKTHTDTFSHYLNVIIK